MVHMIVANICPGTDVTGAPALSCHGKALAPAAGTFGFAIASSCRIGRAIERAIIKRKGSRFGRRVETFFGIVTG